MDLSKADPSKVEVTPAFGLGRFAPFQYERGAYETGIRIFKGWFIFWSLVALVSLWMMAAGGLYFLVKYKRGFEKVEYRHMLLLPFSKSDYRRSKAEYYLEVGREALAAERYAEAFHHLRIGLLEVPEDTEARRIVVEIYLALKRPDLAQILIVDGLAYTAGNLEYLQWVFSSLLRLQKDDAAVDLAKEFLRAVPDASPNARHVVLMAEATAHFFRGRYDEAVAVLRRENSASTQDGLLLLAGISRERGEPERALAYLRKAVQVFPDAAEPYRELVAELKRQGATGAVRRAILERRISQPDALEPFLDEMEILHFAQDEPGWTAQEAEFWTRFGADPRALDQLALRSSHLGRPDTARRVWEQRKAQGGEVVTATTAWVEALLVAGQPKDALTVIQQTEREEGETAGVDLLALRILASATMGEEVSARRSLSAYLERVTLQADLLAVLAQRLARLELMELAEEVWKRALEIDPNHQAVLTQRLHHSLRADDWEQTLPLIERLLTTRKPSRELCGALAQRLASDQYLLIPRRGATLTALQARANAEETGR